MKGGELMSPAKPGPKPIYTDVIVAAIRKAYDCNLALSLFEIATEAECDYAVAHRTIKRLESEGRVKVFNRTRAGASLLIIPLEAKTA